jgi:hypothetical protein
MRSTARVVARSFRNGRGELVTLTYWPRAGNHLVIAYRGSQGHRWDNGTVKEARARWGLLRADLVAQGFAETK